MAIPIFPVAAAGLPLTSDLEIDGIINSFGSGYEQRIVTGLPRGPRADGEGNLTTYIGVNIFNVGLPQLLFQSQPVVGNSNLDNSVRLLWDFYKARFYNAATNVPQWEAFYWYNPDENDDITTWFGDTTKAGTNSRGEAVSEATGRYLVRFELGLSRIRFVQCVFRFNLTLREVAA